MLAEAHVPVKLYEATAHAGGRARSMGDEALGSVDHGLHLIEGDARELFAYMARIGADDTLQRIPHPLRPPAAPLADYLALLPVLWRRAGTLASLVHSDNRLGEQWLKSLSRLSFHSHLTELPIACVRHYLWRKIRQRKRGLHCYLPRSTLADSLVKPALAHLDYHGGSIYFGHALRGIDRRGDVISGLNFTRKKIMLAPEDVLVLATPPAFVKTLLPHLPVPADGHASITTHFATTHRQPSGSVHVITDGPVDIVRFGDGCISTTSRVADDQWHADSTLAAERIWRWLARIELALPGAMPQFTTVRERRSGHRITERKLDNLTGLPPRLLIAGDWVESDAPASLEAAAASGHRAARAAMALIPRFQARTQ
jgi:hypothetical protein